MTNAKVELFDIALKGCRYSALYIPGSSSETTVVATRCEFANSQDGVRVYNSLQHLNFVDPMIRLWMAMELLILWTFRLVVSGLVPIKMEITCVIILMPRQRRLVTLVHPPIASA